MKAFFAPAARPGDAASRSISIRVPKPLATFYIWARVPAGVLRRQTSRKMLIEKVSIMVTPGSRACVKRERLFGRSRRAKIAYVRRSNNWEDCVIAAPL